MNKSTLLIALTLTAILILASCQKEIKTSLIQAEEKSSANQNALRGHLQQTKTFSPEVVLKWIDLNRRLLLSTTRTAPGIKVNREFAYTGIALYESVVPGMPANQSISSQLNEMPPMPSAQPGFAYHWGASDNAALAAMNRFFFSNASVANKTSMDSLEAALNKQFQSEVSAENIQRSVQFGKDVAQKVIQWSNTDGADHAFDAYTPPAGAGLWIPTPTAFVPAVGPYWKNNRTMVAGSINGALPPPLLPYSEEPSSEFFKMQKEVYDASQTLTAEQIAIGLFWFDAGIGSSVR